VTTEATADAKVRARPRAKVCVVGAGMHFISGPSYYTYFLSKALTESCDVSVILLRELVPRFLYPGKSRVGTPISTLSTSEFAPTFNGIDWPLVPSVPKALKFLRQQRPDVLVLEWWTASALPAYFALTRAAKKLKIPVIVELHEELHAAEAKVPLAGPLAARGLERLVRNASALVVHSPFAKENLVARYGIDEHRVAVVHLGPFDLAGNGQHPTRDDQDPTTILFFGTVRPYKGLEVLIEAFDTLSDESPGRWRLVVVGEPWEGWQLPFDKIAASRHKAMIETIPRYVRDDEIPAIFQRADVVALPYLESTASGPLHLTMAAGLPVVVTDVGGSPFATSDYDGAILVPARDPDALAKGIDKAVELIGTRFKDPHSWDHTRAAFDELFVNLLVS
jgi:glycosyltransferase involved in cell wall biosynthesis